MIRKIIPLLNFFSLTLLAISLMSGDIDKFKIFLIIANAFCILLYTDD